MYHLTIEREIFLSIMAQFMTRAARLEMSKKQLATRAGITDVYLSNMNSKGKTWRPLTPEMARKFMAALNYRASQINGVVAILEHFKKSRTRRRHVADAKGVSQIDVLCELIDLRNKHQAQMTLHRKKSGATVSLRIDCDSEKVSFFGGKGKAISGPESALRLFPDSDGAHLMLVAILLSLDDQSWKALASDLNNLDTESDALHWQARSHVLSGTWGMPRVAHRAREVFEQHMEDNRTSASR